MGLFLIIMGVQGAGKGEQARKIQSKYGIPQVSTGDLFRAMRSRTDEFALKITKRMDSGELISDEDTNEIVRQRLSQPDAANGVILDGYPRTPGQAAWLENHLAEQGQKINAVLLLDLNLYDAFRRAFGRVSTSDGTSYNIYTNAESIQWQFSDHPEAAYPPRLDATLKTTGEKLKRRADDASAHAIIKRIDKYLQETQPLIAYYREKGLVQMVDAAQSIEVVSQQIISIIDAAKSR